MAPIARIALFLILTILPGRAAEGQREPPCGLRNGVPCTAPGVELASISSGQAHSCGITRNGVAFCWGDGRNGELGNADSVVARFPVQVPGRERFVSIGAGGAFTCALTRTGDLLCWGKAQPVPGWPAGRTSPARLTLERPASSLSVGLRHACVLDRDGYASCWGWNVDGEAGAGAAGLDLPIVPSPSRVAGEHRFDALSAGASFTCGVDVEGGVWCWGSNADGVLGESAPERCGDVEPVPCSTRPVRIPLPGRAAQVSSGSGHACALAHSGRIYCWGTNSSGQLGYLGPPVPGEAHEVPFPAGERFVLLSSGGLSSCAIAESRHLWCWGADLVNMGGKVRHPDDYAPRQVGTSRYTAVAVGRAHYCALDGGGALNCWGDTILGALGRR